MRVMDMEFEVKKIRGEFRELLVEDCSMERLKIFFKEALKKFAGEFEETVLEENLKEELGLYLEGLRKAQGA